ncbi:MAG: chorismate synthase [Clostridia bacterium]|nr:chorismate synthase [Clostridia bacterium]
MLRFLDAGESHGKALTAIIEGMPANLNVSIDKINDDLFRRQQGHGRGKRMSIESDKVEILSGIRNSRTLGSPITLQIYNRDWGNWHNIMHPLNAEQELKAVKMPRPGHADLAGYIKYRQKDIRNILERASARETAIRTAVGSLAGQLLERLNIKIASHVIQIGEASLHSLNYDRDIKQIISDADKSPVRCIDKTTESQMISAIDDAKANGDTIGGIFEIIIEGLPAGIGSHVHWDRKLDASLCYSLMSIQGIKGVEVGLGFKSAELNGSSVHDEIFYKPDRNFFRKTNNAGGIEGGISNGEQIVLKAAMKPIPTLYKPLNSIHVESKDNIKASIERSDACAVPAASIVGKCAVSWSIACAVVEKFGGDCMEELEYNYNTYIEYINSL